MHTETNRLHPGSTPPPLPHETMPAPAAEFPVCSPEHANEVPAAPAKREFWPALPTLLRWLGAITLLTSAGAFLLNWMPDQQLWRYGQLVGFTVILSACGWFCISRWRDDKGARTFFALTTALIPAHFAQLGGMLYAFREGEKSFAGFREAFQFEAMSGFELAAAFGAGLAVIIPLTYLGFAAMARPFARQLTTVFLTANAALLLTVRSPDWVALIGFAMLGGLCWADHRLFAPHSRMRTWDGVAMRCLLFVPYGLLVGRNLLLHSGHSELLYSLFFATVAGLLYLGLPRVLKNPISQNASRVFALVPAAAAWMLFASDLWLGSVFHGPPDLMIPTALLPICAISLGLSTGMSNDGRVIRRLAVVTAMAGSLCQMVVFESPMASFLMVTISLAGTLGGYAMRERWVFRTGLAGLAGGLLYHLRFAAELYQGDFLWLSLAGTGVLALLGSSFLERYGRRSLDWVRIMHHRVSEWR